MGPYAAISANVNPRGYARARVRYESDPAAARDHADGAAARETYKTGARWDVALLFAGCW